jgi:hypothetical protein
MLLNLLEGVNSIFSRDQNRTSRIKKFSCLQIFKGQVTEFFCSHYRGVEKQRGIFLENHLLSSL